jgi:hypothetical protein
MTNLQHTNNIRLRNTVLIVCIVNRHLCSFFFKVFIYLFNITRCCFFLSGCYKQKQIQMKKIIQKWFSFSCIIFSMILKSV